MAKDQRLYGRFTLDFADSPKIMPLSDAAFRCLVEATLYSRRMMTDGFLAKPLALARWGATPLLELATNDAEKPSLIEVENGYIIHDFAEHQSTKADIEALRERRKAAGSKGGQASAVAKRKQVVSKTSSKIKPETETETEVKEPPNPQGDSQEFEAFWDVYPSKVGKGQARTAFARALKKADLDVIVQGARSYRDDPKRKSDYTKNPSTWLNGECWADEKPVEVGRPRLIANGLWEGD